MIKLTLSERVLRMTPSATLGMQAKAKALRDAGVPVITLSAGEPDFETPAPIIEHVHMALNKGALSKYTPVRGTDEMIEAMQVKFRRDQKISYAADEVMSTVGAKSAVALALEAVVNPFDEVIIFAPYWVSYPELVQLFEGVPIVVSASAKENFLPTKEQFQKAITPKTKAVIFNWPNNPSGSVISKERLQDLMSVLEGTNIWVISDEIYESLIFDGLSHVTPAGFSEDARLRTLVISGLSKAYAMTGWRVGIAAGPKALIAAMAKLQGQQTTCVPAIAQAAAAYALKEPKEVQAAKLAMREAYEKRRNRCLEILETMPDVGYFKPGGAFYILLNLSKYLGKPIAQKTCQDDVELSLRILEEAHVALVPGTPFGVPGWVRMSIASSMDELETALERIGRWLRSAQS